MGVPADSYYAEIIARRTAVLSSARISRADRARIMGHALPRPAAKEHRIEVDIKAKTKKIETISPTACAKPPWEPTPVVAPVRQYFKSAYADIYNAVADTWGITVFALLSERRTQRLARPRFALCRLLRERGLSTPVIGRMIRRDHTTIIDALKRAEFLRLNDTEWARRYHAAARLLQGDQ